MTRLQTPDIMGDVLVAHAGPEMIDLAAFATDGGTQMRAAIDTPTVNEYEDALLAADGNWPFPPVIAYYDGSAYWLADGFHRIAAARLAQTRTNAPTDVRAGTRRDAILYAAGANASHGLRRTQADKRRSVETLLRDEEWRKWSDREIARICHVSADLVGDVRKTIAPPVTVDSDSETVRTYTNRHGGTSTMRVDNIGSNQPQYAPVWVLQGHVGEFARANGWQAPDLRRAARNQRVDVNYLTLETVIIVDYRRADLVQAINNVADAWESREEQQRKAKEWQVVQLPADIAASGYQIHWKAADGWRVLDPDGANVQTGLNSLSECANLIRRLVPPAVPAGRPLMEVIRTDEELAAEAEAADIAEREAAADEAERQCLRLVVVAELNDVALLTAMRRYWSDRDLRSFASDADPEAACRRHIVKSPSGSVDDRFRIETGQGHVSIWLKEHGDYWHRKADGAYTYNRWALLTIGLLPQLLPAQVAAETDPWAAAEHSQAEPALEFVAGDPKPVRPGTIGGPDTYLPARLAPVSQRDDYDGDEWYTPAEYVNAARRVMGSIDLDPASCDMAQTVVQAGAYLTKEKNGLRSSHWQHHNIWLNPPYSDPARWIEKLLAEYDRGTYVQQAVVLVNNATETAWFQALLARNFSVCLLSRRVAFWRHDQAGVTARQGQAIFYLGRNVNAFVNEFESFGPIVRRVE